MLGFGAAVGRGDQGEVEHDLIHTKRGGHSGHHAQLMTVPRSDVSLVGRRTEGRLRAHNVAHHDTIPRSTAGRAAELW